MCYLYVTENGYTIGCQGNLITIRREGKIVRSVPYQLVDGIKIMGASQMTTQCVKRCLQDHIQVSFMSQTGKLYGHLFSSGSIRASLQRKQSRLYDTPFALQFSKSIIQAKIHNQMTVLRRYMIDPDKNQSYLNAMRSYSARIKQCVTIQQISGYEGKSARLYFKGLSESILPEFAFDGRSRRPPEDPFNALISLGYSIVFSEIESVAEMKGLNTYFGFMHHDDEKHPTLISDLIEEWRAPIVDSVAMSMINGRELACDDFYSDETGEAIYLTQNAKRKFIHKIESRMAGRQKYLTYTDEAICFRTAIEEQMDHLIRAIENEDASEYKPLRIR